MININVFHFGAKEVNWTDSALKNVPKSLSAINNNVHCFCNEIMYTLQYYIVNILMSTDNSQPFSRMGHH